jgi:hypothetical protein
MGRTIPIPIVMSKHLRPTEAEMNEMRPAPRIIGGPEYENYARYLEAEMLEELAREKRKALASMSWWFRLLRFIKQLLS